MPIQPVRILVAALCLSAARLASAAGPSWTCTTADAPWVARPAPPVVVGPAADADLVVHLRAPLQRVDGFGGCFNELGWGALLAMPEADRTRVLRDLFADDGCGFTLARMPIGASDYARDWYSLDDTPGDLALAHFSIDRDRACLLKYVAAAMAVRPELGLWLSAWSPPAWMKDNDRYHSGHLRPDPAVHAAYAAYLARAVQAYQGQGLHVYAAMVQNEPRSDNVYPTCLWTGQQERDFIRDHMGPTFRDRHVDAELWLGTLNDANVDDYAGPVLSDPGVAPFVAGVAYQWEGRDAIAETHRRFPRAKLMQSESECGGGANSFADAEHTFGLLRTYFNGGAGSYFYWNMVLGPDGKSSWGWRQNALVSVDPDAKRVAYHPEFYLMKHASHFVRPGSHLATTTGRWVDELAFIGSDGSAVVLLGNSSNGPLPVVIGLDDDGSGSADRTARAVLPGHSFSTFVIPAVAAAAARPALDVTTPAH